MIIKDVAILIPVFNKTDDLVFTLDTIQACNQQIDIIIVDDGSYYPVSETINEYILRIYHIRSETNKGIEVALNIGLNYAMEKGYKYVLRIDAGDIYYCERALKQKQFLDQNQSYALVGSWANAFDDNKKLLFTYKPPKEYYEIKKRMHITSCFIHVSVMYRTSILNDIGKYNSRYKGAIDYEFFFRIIKKYKCHIIDEPLVAYEITEKKESISVKKRYRQLYSKLFVQLRYFDFSLVHSYFGIFRTLVLFIIPHKINIYIKNKLWKDEEKYHIDAIN
jgi:glycosyltransferase involved in cell wall biosynthesis